MLFVALTSLAAILILPASAMAMNAAELPDQQVMGPSLHPSGNDRTVENGGSGTQGKSPSDPDGDYNYGEDKNGLDGGVYTGDQDGNNGCGNDQDFEDDNNGNCGGARKEVCPDGEAPGNSLFGLLKHLSAAEEDCTPDECTKLVVLSDGTEICYDDPNYGSN